MKIIKKLWINIISIAAEFWVNILLFHTPVKLKRFVFVNIYKIIILSILVVVGIIAFIISKFL